MSSGMCQIERPLTGGRPMSLCLDMEHALPSVTRTLWKPRLSIFLVANWHTQPFVSSDPRIPSPHLSRPFGQLTFRLADPRSPFLRISGPGATLFVSSTLEYPSPASLGSQRPSAVASRLLGHPLHPSKPIPLHLSTIPFHSPQTRAHTPFTLLKSV